MDPLDPRISNLDALDNPTRLRNLSQLDPRRVGQSKAESVTGHRYAKGYAQPVDKFPNLLIRVILTLALANLAIFGAVTYWINSNG